MIVSNQIPRVEDTIASMRDGFEKMTQRMKAMH